MLSSFNSKDALLTEHFQYTPLSLIDNIINTVNAIIYRTIQAIKSGFLSTSPQVLSFGVDTSSASLRIQNLDGDGDKDFPKARKKIENDVH
ncbi:hypothetical protein MMC14_003270 [Varicellaria rhodocarpa]|nr:hypothetical protein [Varicellaria rhodocarpa]